MCLIFTNSVYLLSLLSEDTDWLYVLNRLYLTVLVFTDFILVLGMSQWSQCIYSFKEIKDKKFYYWFKFIYWDFTFLQILCNLIFRMHSFMFFWFNSRKKKIFLNSLGLFWRNSLNCEYFYWATTSFWQGNGLDCFNWQLESLTCSCWRAARILKKKVLVWGTGGKECIPVPQSMTNSPPIFHLFIICSVEATGKASFSNWWW